MAADVASASKAAHDEAIADLNRCLSLVAFLAAAIDQTVTKFFFPPLTQKQPML
jgi:hypothetical protein